ASVLLPGSAFTAQTQWASGQYTNVTHNKRNRQYGPNRIRSANAPLISAGVIIANMPWYMQWSKIGSHVPGNVLWTHSCFVLSHSRMPCRPSRLPDQPIQPPCDSPNARQ